MMCAEYSCRSTLLRIKLLDILLFNKVLSRGAIKALSKNFGSFHVDGVDIRSSHSLATSYRIGTLYPGEAHGSIKRDWQSGTWSKCHHSISYLDTMLILVVDKLG